MPVNLAAIVRGRMSELWVIVAMTILNAFEPLIQQGGEQLVQLIPDEAFWAAGAYALARGIAKGMAARGG